MKETVFKLIEKNIYYKIQETVFKIIENIYILQDTLLKIIEKN